MDFDCRIDRLAGPSFNASIDDVIDRILFHGDTFFVLCGPTLSAPSADLEVKQHPISERFFLQTYPDGIWDNNLYSLPEIEAGLRL